MKVLVFLAVPMVAFAAPKIAYRVVNDCAPKTAKEVVIEAPDGSTHQGVECRVRPRLVVDTVKTDSIPKKK